MRKRRPPKIHCPRHLSGYQHIHFICDYSFQSSCSCQLEKFPICHARWEVLLRPKSPQIEHLPYWERPKEMLSIPWRTSSNVCSVFVTTHLPQVSIYNRKSHSNKSCRRCMTHADERSVLCELRDWSMSYKRWCHLNYLQTFVSKCIMIWLASQHAPVQIRESKCWTPIRRQELLGLPLKCK